jgi:hypothetical protein
MKFLLSEFQFSPEFIVSMFGFAASVGAFYALSKADRKSMNIKLDKVENRLDTHEKTLNDVVKSQAVNGERLTNMNEKVDEIFKSLLRRGHKNEHD